MDSTVRSLSAISPFLRFPDDMIEFGSGIINTDPSSELGKGEAFWIPFIHFRTGEEIEEYIEVTVFLCFLFRTIIVIN